MIIKRRYTKSFVTLENRLVRDTKLSLDEHGMLHYLLSLPDDWEVSQAQCAKFWRIGRDKCNRIFRNLARYGWAQMETLRTEDNTKILRVQWIITDEPGAEVIDEALLNETSKYQEPENPEVESNTPENQPIQQPPFQVPENQVPEKAVAAYIDSTKTDSEENRLSQRGVRDDLTEISGKLVAGFTELLKLWPPDNVLSRVAAEQAWERKGKFDRQKAFDLAPRYLDDCRASTRKVCDLTTYLREERYERFVAAKPGANGALWVIKPNTPQWFRWREYKLASGQSVKLMDAQGIKGASFTVPSEWPPAMPPRPEGAPSADTGPPDPP
jgi:hypothetical protein